MTRNGSTSTVVVIGSANMDMVLSCKTFPRPGETVLAASFSTFPGGKGANQAVAAARLEWPVTFLGMTGLDAFRDEIERSLKRAGVARQVLLAHPTGNTGVAVITVDGAGENQILVASGSNMELSPEHLRTNQDVFEDAAVVLLQLEIPLTTVREAARLAAKNEALVILNPAPSQRIPADLLPMIDVLTPNEHEARGLLRDTHRSVDAAAGELCSRGVGTVIVTRGSKGVLIVNGDGSRELPAYATKVVDTTAAGDAFNGALATRLAAGDTVDEAADFAMRVASICVSRRGAQASMPSLAEVESLGHTTIPTD